MAERTASDLFERDDPFEARDGDLLFGERSGDPEGADPTAPAPRRSPSHRARRSKWFAIMAVVGALVAVCSGVVLAVAHSMIDRYESRVAREDILGDVPRTNPEGRWDTGPLNFLLLGSDAQDGDSTLDDPAGGRSDTIMIIHVSKNLESAFIFSIPRDSYVYVPAGGSWSGGTNKINAAFAYGGARLAARTVYELTQIPLDSAMIVNFGGINKMVEAVDGVRVCLPYTVRSSSTRVWVKGCHDMDPDEAAEFVRERKGVPGGDFGRIYDQQLVVKALIAKISSQGMLTNPAKLDRLVLTAADSVTVDQQTDLRDLVLALKGIDPAKITFATAPYRGTMMTDAGSSVRLNTEAAEELFAAVRDDRTDAWLAAHPQRPPGT